MDLRHLAATAYLTPLREGGSLPGVVEAEDGERYVMKFVGAGQGEKALVAELLGSEIGRALGLPVPEIVFLDLDPAIGRSEPDQEIQDLLQASVGRNLGLRYLPNAFSYNALRKPDPEPELASRIVWFDAYITNVDRTDRNVNMLLWQDQLWLIDHGASLYFHHDWNDYLARSRSPFALIQHHTLLPLADRIPAVDPTLRSQLTPEVIQRIVANIPDEWLVRNTPFETPHSHRQAYVDYLLTRLDAADGFVQEAVNARSKRP